ncbi:hypothetical protein [Martelella mangrovi]|uniref:WG repeat-containing protein n=1 Tax=Martelella mangrovi TaxID=1397477 RepID=A0ABV2IIQ3_9HYPH
MLKTILTRTAVIVVGLIILLFVFAQIFRGPSAGGYRFISEYQLQVEPDAKGSLAEIPAFLPLVTLYGDYGERRMRLLLLPGVKLAVPLVHPVSVLRDALLLRYETTEDGAITFRQFMGRRGTRHMFPISAQETEARREQWQGLLDLRVAQMRQLAEVPATENGWVSGLGNGTTTLVLPPDYVYRRGVLESLDVNKDSYMKFERDMGRPLPDIEEQFSRRFYDFIHTEDDIFLSKTADGGFFLQAIREFDNDNWVMTGIANDFEAAVKHIAIIRSLRDDGQPWRIVGDDSDYLISPVLRQFPTYQDQVNRAFREWLSVSLQPGSIVREEPFMKRTFTPEIENDAGAKLYNSFSVGLSLSAKDRDLSTENGEVLAVSADQSVHIETLPRTDNMPPSCLAQGIFTLLPADGDKQLGVEISVESASLPDCRLAAEVLVGFGKSGLAAGFDLESIAPLSDYFGQFNDATLHDGGIMLLRQGRAGAVTRTTGEPVVPLKENTLFLFLTEDMLIGRSNDPDRPGVTVYDPAGKKIVELDYDDLQNTGNPEGVWRNIFVTAKGEKHGLYDLKNKREIADARYDRFSILPDWNMALARRGDVTDFLRPDGSVLIPDGASDYIFAAPMRGIPPEDDFIAVRHVSDGNWRFLTKKDIPLLEGVFTDVKRLPRPVAREFELTKLNGERLYIAVTREGRVQTIPAPD